MECMINSSKYEAVAVPGRVGMEECSLDLIYFYKGQLDYLVFWLGMGCFFQ